MKLRSVGVVLVLLALGNSAAAQKEASSAQDVSYCDLVKAPQTFSGKRIRVRAIYKYGFEIQRLDPPACCPDSGIKIWVEIEAGLKGQSLKLFRKFPKGMGLALATFIGTFESGGPYGDGGYRFKFTVDEIEKLEATAKPSAHHDPVWVPKNCEGSGPTPAKETAPITPHTGPYADGTRLPSRKVEQCDTTEPTMHKNERDSPVGRADPESHQQRTA